MQALTISAVTQGLRYELLPLWSPIIDAVVCCTPVAVQLDAADI